MRGLGIVSLIFGIVGVLFCWFGVGIVPAVLAIVFGLAACFNPTSRGIAAMGLILGLIGGIVSAGVAYGLVYVGRHPAVALERGQEWLDDFVEKETFLKQYSGEVIEKARRKASVPSLLIISPRTYMALLINELKKHPEEYPTKVEE